VMGRDGDAAKKAKGKGHRVKDFAFTPCSMPNAQIYWILTTGCWLLKSLRFERVRRRRTIERFERLPMLGGVRYEKGQE
jgi:hypothetical protein